MLSILAVQAASFSLAPPFAVTRARSHVTRSHAACLASSHLAKQYRARWAHDLSAMQASSVGSSDSDSSKVVAARASASLAGASFAALVGVAISEALADASISQLNMGSFSSPSRVIDKTFELVDSSNAMFGISATSLGELATALAVGVDALAFFGVLFIVLSYQADKRLQAATAGQEDDDSCMIVWHFDEEKEICGPMSFDSSDMYHCVEVEGRWVCA